MSRLSPISGRYTGSHGASLPPHTGGGGDDGRNNRDSDDRMPNYGERLRRARMGLAVAMTPICALFLSFTAVYLAERGFFTLGPGGLRSPAWFPVSLPWPLLLLNTAVLIASTITMELARRDIARQAALAPIKSIPGISLGDERNFPWLALTTLLGAAFLAGQVFVWSGLSAHGFRLNTGPASAFVYVLTAMHGFHLAGGALALLYADVSPLLHRPIESRRIIVDITAWYWHCMTALWIYILVLLAISTQ